MKRNVKQFYNFIRTFCDIQQVSSGPYNLDTSELEFTAAYDTESDSYDEYLKSYDSNETKTIIMPILHYEDFYYQTVNNESSFTIDCWSSLFQGTLSSI